MMNNFTRAYLRTPNQFLLFISFCFFLPLISYAQTGTSTWVKVGTDGRLQYTPDSKGNTIPDFSMVGYKNGNVAIPNVAVVKTLTALTGDNLSQIQNAINEVAAMPLQTNGFRGAILLKAGQFNISNTVNITASGIVLRGEGNTTSGTRLLATRTAQHTLINIAGSGSPTEVTGTRVPVTNTFVPVGAKSFNVQSVSGYAVGDEIIFRVEPKQAWIDLIGTASYGWTPSAYNMSYLRTITKIEGNKVFIDAPVVDPVDVNLKLAYIYKYTWNNIENIGIENIYFNSVFTGTEDENHGWTAVSINRAQHCWVRNSNFYHWGYSAVFVQDWGVNVSVLNCQNLEPISQTTGGRKYSFNMNGQLGLVKDCYTNSGRHDYVTGSTTAGPNAFINCKADNMKADIGPHHRWATGLLFDNVVGNGEQNVQNRGTSGSGHGWAGAQTLFWNCTARQFRVQQPPQHLNWAIGCKGTVTDDGNWVDGNPGIWQSTGNFVVPPQSIYEKQLQDRLAGAPNNPPTVSISSPANGASFTEPATIIINATAADSDGTVSKVEFFQGTTKLGEDLTAPYSYTWSNVAAGSYSLTAKATDNGGSFTTSSAVNVTVTNPAPSVNITSPANGATFTAPASITIDATASDANGTVSKVDFYNGSTFLGTDATAPYSFTWNNVAAGNYTLTARATDNAGAVTTSSAVSVTVNEVPGCPAAIASADDGNVATNVLDNNFATRWSASGDGQWIQFCLTNTSNVMGVEIAFYSGNLRSSRFDVLVGPDGVNWTTAALGLNSSGTSTAFETFNFVARTGKYVRIVGHGNNVNLWNSFTEVRIKTTTNNIAPTTSITSPANGATFTAPANITINANAADSDGFVTKVEFFNGATKLGEDVSAPYSFAWTNVTAGSYSLTTRVTDNAGVITTSSPVSITVNAQSLCPWTVMASAHDGNIPENTLDNNLATRWSASGDGQWIQYCLSSTSNVTGVQIAFYNGNIRQSIFDVQVSSDATTWTNAATGLRSSGTSTALETFTFPSRTARYVRILGHGNSANLWNSYTEVKINATTTATSVSGRFDELTIAPASSTRLITFPNPVSNKSKISFSIESDSKTVLSVYDQLGRQVAVLENAFLKKGNYTKDFDASELPGGVYIIQLNVNGKSITQKITKQ